jgi:predicted RNA-binding protein YlqC (UPF0109 family)
MWGTAGSGTPRRIVINLRLKVEGKAIGKGGRNISSIRHIAKRHQEIDEVQVV